MKILRCGDQIVRHSSFSRQTQTGESGDGNLKVLSYVHVNNLPLLNDRIHSNKSFTISYWMHPTSLKVPPKLTHNLTHLINAEVCGEKLQGEVAE